MKKIVMIALALTVVIATISAQQATQVKKELTEADKAWARMPIYQQVLRALSTGLDETREDRRFAMYIQDLTLEQYGRILWKWGVQFWKNFPNDPRRFEWLELAAKHKPNYVIDVHKSSEAKAVSHFYNNDFEVDRKAIDEWETQFLNFLAEFKKSPEGSEERIYNLNTALLFEDLSTEMSNKGNRGMNKKTNLVKWQQRIRQYADLFYGKYKDQKKTSNRSPISVLGTFVFYCELFDLTLDDASNLIEQFANTPYPEFKEYIASQKRLLALRTKPMEFKWISIEGKPIDLQKMKGKVVLLDFWSTGCGTCIAKMPEIRRVYEKYQNQGFEVVSIAANTQKDKDQIIKIKEKIGASWPTLIIGHETDYKQPSLTNEIWKTYGFKFVPQLLLFDRNGLLIKYNSNLLWGDFESIIVNALGNI